MSAYTGLEADVTHGGTFDDSHDVRIVFEAEERVVTEKTVSLEWNVATVFAEDCHKGLDARIVTKQTISLERHVAAVFPVTALESTGNDIGWCCGFSKSCSTDESTSHRTTSSNSLNEQHRGCIHQPIEGTKKRRDCSGL